MLEDVYAYYVLYNPGNKPMDASLSRGVNLFLTLCHTE